MNHNYTDPEFLEWGDSQVNLREKFAITLMKFSLGLAPKEPDRGNLQL